MIESKITKAVEIADQTPNFSYPNPPISLTPNLRILQMLAQTPSPICCDIIKIKAAQSDEGVIDVWIEYVARQ